MTNVGMILLCIASLCIAGIIYYTMKTRKAYRKPVLVSYALAGSEVSNLPDNVPELTRSVNLRSRTYRSKNGAELDPENYYHFITHGNSMQYCNINDGDLLFVTKNFKIGQLNSFPAIVVLRRLNSAQGRAHYKLRRAWACCKITDDFDEILRSIMNLRTFDVIKQIPSYDGEEELIKDFFEVRLSRYKENHKNDMENSQDVVVSTTFHTNENKVRFSIHPTSTIEGIVIGAFPGKGLTEGITTADTSNE